MKQISTLAKNIINCICSFVKLGQKQTHFYFKFKKRTLLVFLGCSHMDQEHEYSQKKHGQVCKENLMSHFSFLKARVNCPDI